MLTYIRNHFASRYKHPLMASFFFIAGIFAIVGLLIEFVVIPTFEWPTTMVSAFFGIYAVFFAALGLIAYAVVYLVYFSSLWYDRLSRAS